MLRSGDIITLGAAGLLALGVVMVNSASVRVDAEQAMTATSVLTSKAAFHGLLAAVAMLIASRLPLREIARSERLVRYMPLLFVVLVGLLGLVYIDGIGRTVNGARRWLYLPGTSFSFQPSELAKWGMLIVLTCYGVSRAARIHQFRTGLLPGLAMLGIVSAVVALEDLGTGVLIAASGCLVLVAAGARVWHLAMFIPIGLAGFAAAVWSNPYRIDRITSFLDPYAQPQGDGYHMIQSLVAISNGHGAGRGLGFGLQKFGYLPEDQTDFLFAIVCEELGLAGAGLVVGAYIVLICTAVGIVRRQQDPLLKLFALGVTATFGLQAVINLFVVTGMAPTKGIALPLMSYGGTGWIMTAACLGLLAAIDRAQPEEETGLATGPTVRGADSIVPA